jgi:hypothetical protein
MLCDTICEQEAAWERWNQAPLGSDAVSARAGHSKRPREASCGCFACPTFRDFFVNPQPVFRLPAAVGGTVDG